jgi:hypothetical protein
MGTEEDQAAEPTVPEGAELPAVEQGPPQDPGNTGGASTEVTTYEAAPVEPEPEPVLEVHTISPSSFDPALVDPSAGAKAQHEGTVNDATVEMLEGVRDVEVATVPKHRKHEGEFMRPLTVEDSVVLKKHEAVPHRLQGRRATVLEAPQFLIPADKQDEVWIKVHVGDEIQSDINVPLAATSEIIRR